jgi:hypothetical protein
MVERRLMRQLFQLAHDRLTHLLGADDLAALRLDVGGAQPGNCIPCIKLVIRFLFFCLLRFPHDQIAWISQAESIALSSKLTFHFHALSVSERVD